MSATAIFVIGIVAAALLAAAGIFTVAARRGPAAGPVTGSFDRRAARKDRESRRVQAEAAAGGGVATLVETEVEAEPHVEEGPIAATPVFEKQVVSAAEYGVTRRQFFNRAILGLFGGAFLGGLGLAFLAFLWPKLKGGFGSKITTTETIGSLRSQLLNPDGTVSPVFLASAQSWIVPFDESKAPGSSFDGLPVYAGGGGGELALMALWQRCVHLGCRVPSCESSQGFECPCHGSKYNLHGEYVDGPAPRNMDRFAVEVNEAGNLVIDTGSVLETTRAKTKTIAYPQGPSCL
jgi:cytochrome b6-f complex iron-sulfur subunit